MRLLALQPPAPQDFLAYFVEGLRKGEVRSAPALVPLLLRADGKVPKGFENFFPKDTGSRTPEASDGLCLCFSVCVDVVRSLTRLGFCRVVV